MQHEAKERIEAESDKEPRRRPYRAPRLVVYGDAGEITKAVAGLTADGYSGSEFPSDRNAKENFAAVDALDVLSRLVALPIESWNYKGESISVRHIGPMAQDFAEAFGVGEDDKRIHVVDASGVALASIQALHSMLLEKGAEIRALERLVGEMRAELKELRESASLLG